MIRLEQLAEFLDRFFAVHRFGEEERGGVYWRCDRPIVRLGLALESWPDLPEWAFRQGLDALFLHRPWKFLPEQTIADLGVISYHLPFDERLTLGFNSRLAEMLGISELSVLGEKQGRAIGMMGEIPSESFASLCDRIAEIFGGFDLKLAGNDDIIDRVAVVGAMTDALVREAALCGADIYITGQLRQPAQATVEETGMAVIAVGHRRSEEWALRALAGVLRDRFCKLEVILPPIEKSEISDFLHSSEIYDFLPQISTDKHR